MIRINIKVVKKNEKVKMQTKRKKRLPSFLTVVISTIIIYVESIICISE